MPQIDIPTLYTVIASYTIVIIITSYNIMVLDKAKDKFFMMVSKINLIFVMVSGMYAVLFTYDALNNYRQFLASKGTYDNYAIAFCIYYGLIQLIIVFAYKIIKFSLRNKRMIKK